MKIALTLAAALASLAGKPADIDRAIANASRASSPATVLAARDPEGKALTAARRDELLQKVKAGDHVEIDLDLLAYEQKTGERNRNFVRFRDGLMVRLGSSGKGKPFLRDHEQGNVLAIGGTITASRTEKRGEGDYAIYMTVRLSAPWAVELALRDLLNSVSIGWHANERPTCSACSAPVFSKCYHFPGDRLTEVDADGGGKRKVRDANGTIVVEWIYQDAELVECSAVVVPAVPGAHIEGIRASLSASNPGLADETEHQPQGGEMKNRAALIAILGLAATASDEEILSAVEKRQQETTADKAQLTILQTDLSGFKTQIDTLNVDKKKRDEDQFIADALASGRITKGEEKNWRALHTADQKRALELMAERPEGGATPVGQPRQSGTPDPDKAPNPSLSITGGREFVLFNHKGERITADRATSRSIALERKELASQFDRVVRSLKGNPTALAYAVKMFGFEDVAGRVGIGTTLAATSIANNADLDAARIGFHAAFIERLAEEPDDALTQMFLTVPSTRKLEEWDWMGDLPDFEEWTSDRKLASLEGFKLRVSNKKWSSGLKIKNDDIKDDSLGLLPSTIGDLASRAKSHRFDMMVKLLLNGFDGTAYPEVGTGIGYDGSFFFSDAGHRGGNDNKLTLALDSAGLVQAQLQLRSMKTYDGKLPFRTKGTHLLVGPKLEFAAEKILTQDYLANGESNPLKNKYKLLVSDRIEGTYDDYWFLMDLSRGFRPFMFQIREDISSSAIMGGQGTQNDSIPRFMNDEIWFGAEARYNMAYFEHRLIVGSVVA